MTVKDEGGQRLREHAGVVVVVVVVLVGVEGDDPAGVVVATVAVPVGGCLVSGVPLRSGSAS